MRSNTDRTLKTGYILLVMAVFSFSFLSPSAKALSKEIGPPQVLLLRSLFMVLFFGLWAWKRGTPVIGRHYPGLLFLRGFIGTIGFLLFIGALQRLTLADTVLIFQANPLFVALFGPWILKEKNTRVQWLLLAVSLFGVGLVIGPTGGGSMVGKLMALGCAICSGVAYSLVRLTSKKESSITVVLSFPITALIVVTPLILAGFPGFTWHGPSGREWLFLGAVGVSSSMGQMLLTHGLRRVPAGQGTPIFNLQVVLAMFYGYLFFSETPGLITILGSMVIVTSLILLSRTRVKKMEGGFS